MDRGGRERALAVTGGIFYVVVSDAPRLFLVGVSEPTAPAPLGSCALVGECIDPAVNGDLGLVASKEYGLLVVDVGDPLEPALVARHAFNGGGHGVVAVGDHHAILCEAGPGNAPDWSQVLDTSHPISPEFRGHYTEPVGTVEDVHLREDILFVAASFSGLRFFSVADLENPVWLGGYDPGYAYGVATAGDYAYVAVLWDGLYIVDVSDLANPTLVGFTSAVEFAEDVVVFDGYAAVANGSGGRDVFDVSDPTMPV